MEGKKLLTNEKRFYPLLVARPGFTDQTDAESDAVWMKIDQIPQIKKEILLSTDIINNLFLLEAQFHTRPQVTAAIAYSVREMFLENISQSQFYQYIDKLLTQENIPVNSVLDFINNTLLLSQPDPEEVEQDTPVAALKGNTKQYALLDALAKFPALGNQLITGENIKLKSQVALARPTLTNWLKVYRDDLGIGRHESVERARFLFESMNGKSLSDEERERVHLLVRSLEDGEQILVDIDEGKILFPEKKKEKPSQNIPQASGAPSGSPDIFERFATVGTHPLPELTHVGTPRFTHLAEEEQKQEQKEEKQEEAVLQKIRSMLTSPVKANAPAPKEDFFVEEPKIGSSQVISVEATKTILPEVPMGTMTFSAKHVLPAEKAQQIQAPQIQKTPSPTTQTQGVSSVKTSELSKSTPPLRPVLPQTSSLQGLPEEKSSQKEPVGIQTPPMTPAASGTTPQPKTLPQSNPVNVFRIKPSRE